MPYDTRLFLSNIAYAPEKRQITVDFSRENEKASRKYSFFPKMFVFLEKIPKEQLVDALSNYDLKKLKVDFKEKTAIVFAATFSDLKKVNNLFTDFFGFHSNLIEPERQFLIEKEWSYFDCFDFSEGEPQLVLSSEFPNVSLDFLSDSLEKTVASLLFSNKALARETVQKIVYSKLLRVPLVGRDDDKSLEELFLENIFFESEKQIPVGSCKFKDLKLYSHSKAEIDFSKLVSVMASKPFNNIGFETINCECCKPWDNEAKNILPSTLVKVRFLREGFYFNSVSPLWAKAFHYSNPRKEEREKRRREYFYDFYPVGPFSRNNSVKILLADANVLQEQGLVEVLCERSVEWFCLKHESALSKEISSLYSSLSSLGAVMREENASVVASKGLFFSQVLDSSPGFFYKKILRKTISGLLSSFPNMLTFPQNRFFDKSVAIAFETLNGCILRDFEGVAQNSAGRISFRSSKALVDPSSLLSVSREFGRLYNVDNGLLSIEKSF